jgi:hypothetical protein
MIWFFRSSYAFINLFFINCTSSIFKISHNDCATDSSMNAYVKVLKTVTVWVQVYMYRSADWSMISQSSLLFFYNFGFMKVRVSSSHTMISSLLSSWSYSLINLALIGRSLFIGRSVNFREDHVIPVIPELSYSRTVDGPLNLIRRTR